MTGSGVGGSVSLAGQRKSGVDYGYRNSDSFQQFISYFL
jgi:hypothetical protein